MLYAPAPFVSAPDPVASPPKPRERQETWAMILISLALFWYSVGIGINALWGAFVG